VSSQTPRRRLRCLCFLLIRARMTPFFLFCPAEPHTGLCCASSFLFMPHGPTDRKPEAAAISEFLNLIPAKYPFSSRARPGKADCPLLTAPGIGIWPLACQCPDRLSVAEPPADTPDVRHCCAVIHGVVADTFDLADGIVGTPLQRPPVRVAGVTTRTRRARTTPRRLPAWSICHCVPQGPPLPTPPGTSRDAAASCHALPATRPGP
jgi:hypothetical protein